MAYFDPTFSPTTPYATPTPPPKPDVDPNTGWPVDSSGGGGGGRDNGYQDAGFGNVPAWQPPDKSITLNDGGNDWMGKVSDFLKYMARANAQSRQILPLGSTLDMQGSPQPTQEQLNQRLQYSPFAGVNQYTTGETPIPQYTYQPQNYSVYYKSDNGSYYPVKNTSPSATQAQVRNLAGNMGQSLSQNNPVPYAPPAGKGPGTGNNTFVPRQLAPVMPTAYQGSIVNATGVNPGTQQGITGARTTGPNTPDTTNTTIRDTALNDVNGNGGVGMAPQYANQPITLANGQSYVPDRRFLLGTNPVKTAVEAANTPKDQNLSYSYAPNQTESVWQQMEMKSPNWNPGKPQTNGLYSLNQIQNESARGASGGNVQTGQTYVIDPATGIRRDWNPAKYPQDANTMPEVSGYYIGKNSAGEKGYIPIDLKRVAAVTNSPAWRQYLAEGGQPYGDMARGYGGGGGKRYSGGYVSNYGNDKWFQDALNWHI